MVLSIINFGNIDRLMMVYVCQTCSGIQNVQFKKKTAFPVNRKSCRAHGPQHRAVIQRPHRKKKGVSTERSIQIYMNRYTNQYEQVYKSTKISSTTVSRNIFAPHTTSWTLSSKAFRRQQSHRRTISRGETVPTCIPANRVRSLH